MQSIGPYLVGVAFWVFVGACAVAAIITDHLKRRLGMDLLRTALEKGQPLDPAMVETIMANERSEERIDPLHLKLGGIITLSAGIGIAILAFFIAHLQAWALYPILGGGIVVICVGIGLYIGGKVLADSYKP
jgi:Domain of unknown function (DUF6249)